MLDVRKSSLLALIVAAMAFSASAQETNSAPDTSFANFQIISQRNIFNQNRRGPVQRTRVQRRTPTDAFSLVGTMAYSKGTFAFFSGTSSDYNKVAEPGENIAGYKVVEVYPNGVTLEGNGKQLVMRVGTQMRREEGGSWYSSAGVELPVAPTENPDDSGTNETTATSNSGDQASPPSSSSGEVNEVLKRLMQQREQELK